MDNHQFVFVGGLHRSATTLLARILSQHPAVSGATDTGVIEDEGQLLQSVYLTDMAHGGPGRFAFDSASHLTETSPMVGQSTADKLRSEWSPHWDLNRPVLLEKSPPNLIRGRFLQALFPGSAFVFIVRHPVATSLATYKWSGTGIYSLIHHWVTAHHLMRLDLPYLRRAMVITYEALTANPSATLETVERFLGLPAHGYELRIRGEVNQKYYDLWRSRFLVSDSRVRPVPTPRSFYGHSSTLRNIGITRPLKRYIRRRIFGEERQLSLTTFEAQDAVSMFEADVNTFGYSLRDLTREPPSPLVW